ncbi:MAG: GlsB/YeaQ/YmgE family stress response membrane protein, partial [Thermomicrobiales bacterium]
EISVLAFGVTSLTLPPLDLLIVVFLVGLVVGLVAETIVGTHVPLGYMGAVVLGFLGAWVATHVLHFTVSPDRIVNGVPLFRALIGAVILAFLWSLATGRGRWFARH